MHRISPDDKPKAQRKRPVGKSPLKSNSRIIKSQVEGEIEEGANPDDRSITGNPDLNENLGTPIRPDQSVVTAPPNSTLPLKKIVPEEGKEPSKPKKPRATENCDHLKMTVVTFGEHGTTCSY